MICSMTGYGAGESDLAGVRTVVELRSVNGRYCDIAVRLPRSLGSLEGRVRAYVQEHVTRGNVSVSVRCDDGDTGAHAVRIDVEAGKKYCDALRELKEQLGVSGDVSLDMVAAYPGLVTPENEEVDPSERWTGMEAALVKALAAFKEMKRSEGRALETDLRIRVEAILAILRAIEDRAPDRVVEYRERLNNRLVDLLDERQLDPQRVAMEITLFAERIDVTEECVRLRTHCDAFMEALEADGSAGRRLNFLIQEMNREINTIGSKGNDTEISHSVIQAKEELEKVREQVQNIE
ncbi:MAG: YicC family protein [Gemmatimonadetes bacterium]|nr:YicC family protein [Gemmatimonadota bacterium]